VQEKKTKLQMIAERTTKAWREKFKFFTFCSIETKNSIDKKRRFHFSPAIMQIKWRDI